MKVRQTLSYAISSEFEANRLTDGNRLQNSQKRGESGEEKERKIERKKNGQEEEISAPRK